MSGPRLARLSATICILGVLAPVLGACSLLTPSVCGERPLDPGEVPAPDGFTVRDNESLDPEGCGDTYGRQAVVGARGASRVAVLRAYTDHLLDVGWVDAECAGLAASCFSRGDRFLALIPGDTGDGVDEHTGAPPTTADDEVRFIVSVTARHV